MSTLNPATISLDITEDTVPKPRTQWLTAYHMSTIRLIIGILGLALSIVQFPVGIDSLHNPSPDCDNRRLLNPAAWLFVTSLVTLFSSFMRLGSGRLFSKPDYGQLFLIAFVWCLWWGVMDAVSLWRDNVSCGRSA